MATQTAPFKFEPFEVSADRSYYNSRLIEDDEDSDCMVEATGQLYIAGGSTETSDYCFFYDVDLNLLLASCGANEAHTVSMNYNGYSAHFTCTSLEMANQIAQQFIEGSVSEMDFNPLWSADE